MVDFWLIYGRLLVDLWLFDEFGRGHEILERRSVHQHARGGVWGRKALLDRLQHRPKVVKRLLHTGRRIMSQNTCLDPGANN